MRSPRASPGLSSQHWLPPSSSACCANRRNGSTRGKPISAAFGIPQIPTGGEQNRLGLLQPSYRARSEFRSRPLWICAGSPVGDLALLDSPLLEVQGTAREEAQIAVSLDDKDAMAHAVLAHMMMWGSEWEAAIAEARTAVALNPNSAFVISMLGCVLGFGGYREEALERLQQAMRASPHDPLIWLWSIWCAAFAVFFTRFRRCAADIAPSCSPASGLCPHLPIHRRVARLSRAFGRGARSTGTCPPAIGGAASALAAKAALDAARGLCASGRRCPPCSWRAALSVTPRSESFPNVRNGLSACGGSACCCLLAKAREMVWSHGARP